MTPAKAVIQRLFFALRRHNPAASFQIENEQRCCVKNSHIEVVAERIVVSPRLRLRSEDLQLLADPDSTLWFVARLDDADLEGRMVRFFAKQGIALPADWLRGAEERER